MKNAQVAEGISAMLSSNLNHRQCLIFCCWTCPSTFTLAGDDSEDLTSALRVSQRRASAALQDEDEEESVVRPVKLQVVRKPVPDQNTVVGVAVLDWQTPSGIFFCSLHPLCSRFCRGACFCSLICLEPAGRICMYVCMWWYLCMCIYNYVYIYTISIFIFLTNHKQVYSYRCLVTYFNLVKSRPACLLRPIEQQWDSRARDPRIFFQATMNRKLLGGLEHG